MWGFESRYTLILDARGIQKNIGDSSRFKCRAIRCDLQRKQKITMSSLLDTKPRFCVAVEMLLDYWLQDLKSTIPLTQQRSTSLDMHIMGLDQHQQNTLTGIFAYLQGVLGRYKGSERNCPPGIECDGMILGSLTIGLNTINILQPPHPPYNAIVRIIVIDVRPHHSLHFKGKLAEGSRHCASSLMKKNDLSGESARREGRRHQPTFTVWCHRIKFFTQSRCNEFKLFGECLCPENLRYPQGSNDPSYLLIKGLWHTQANQESRSDVEVICIRRIRSQILTLLWISKVWPCWQEILSFRRTELPKSDDSVLKDDLLLSGSAFICETCFAFFQWDKVQRPFEGSPASLKALHVLLMVNVMLSICLCYLYCAFFRLCVSAFFVIKLAAVLLLYLILNLHPSFHLHCLVMSSSFKQPFEEPTFLIIVHWHCCQ